MNSKTLTGVGAVFCAAHKGFKKRNVLHGHSYEVTAWFIYSGQDAEKLQAELSEFLICKFDHRELERGLARGEEIAYQILTGLNCERVEVRRPLERLYVEISR